MVLENAAQTTADKSIFVLMQTQSLNVFYTDLIEIELVPSSSTTDKALLDM